MTSLPHRLADGPALADLHRAARLLRVIAFMAAGDLRARYRRSVLGPFWMTLGTAIGTLGLGLVWSELLHMDQARFVPSLTTGLVMWQLLSGCSSYQKGIICQRTTPRGTPAKPNWVLETTKSTYQQILTC